MRGEPAAWPAGAFGLPPPLRARRGDRARDRPRTIAEARELTARVARKQPHRCGRFAATWLCLWLEGHEKTTLDDVALLVSNLRSRDPEGSQLGARDPEQGRTAALTAQGGRVQKSQ